MEISWRICKWVSGLRVKNHQLRRLRIRMFAVWEANLTLHKKKQQQNFPSTKLTGEIAAFTLSFLCLTKLDPPW